MDHVFRKHMGDNGLLHCEHFANHDVSACNGKPVNLIKMLFILLLNVKGS